MLINLKWIHATRGDFARALLALDRIISLTPDSVPGAARARDARRAPRLGRGGAGGPLAPPRARPAGAGREEHPRAARRARARSRVFSTRTTPRELSDFNASASRPVRRRSWASGSARARASSSEPAPSPRGCPHRADRLDGGAAGRCAGALGPRRAGGRREAFHDGGPGGGAFAGLRAHGRAPGPRRARPHGARRPLRRRRPLAPRRVAPFGDRRRPPRARQPTSARSALAHLALHRVRLRLRLRSRSGGRARLGTALRCAGRPRAGGEARQAGPCSSPSSGHASDSAFMGACTRPLPLEQPRRAEIRPRDRSSGTTRSPCPLPWG